MSLRASMALSLIALPVLATPAFAAELAPEIVVTATRTELDRTQVGSSVSVLTAEDIEQRQYSFTVDALRAMPGLTVTQNGPFGGQATVRIRGAASGQTLVLIDGVTVNDPSTPGGTFNFANLDPYDIERIEVLRGPQSTLYGSQAIGGVVSIITKRGKGSMSVSGFVEGGSFATARAGATVSGSKGETDYRVSLSGNRTNGISKADENDGNIEEDGYRNYTLTGAGGHNLTETLRLEGAMKYAESRSEYDTFGGPGGDGDQVSYIRELLLSGTARLTTFGGQLEHSLTAGYTMTDGDFETGGVRSFTTTGQRTSVEYLAELQTSDMWNALVGLKTEETEIRDTSSVRTNSVFGQVQVLPVENLSFIGGVRLDDHEETGNVTTFRFTGAYELEETGTVFRATWGEGFKSPTPFQLTFFCCGAIAPNPDLKPEESRGWDAGIEQSFADGKYDLQVNYFEQDVTNQIDFSFALGGYENIDRVETSGWEVIGTAYPLDWLDVAASFTHQRAIDMSTGSQLVRVPPNLATLDITTRPMDGLSIGGAVTYNDEETDAGGTVADWVRVDLRSAYRVDETVELYGRVENLFDEQYQDILGFGTPGLSAYIGIRLRG